MTAEPVLLPDERTFQAHLGRPSFTAGVDRCQWRLIEVAWPEAFMSVRAGPRPGAPDDFFFRFDLTGYPTTAPTAAPWDMNSAELLAPAMRPKGEIIGSVFRADWEGGRALYAPFDRVALNGHPDWRTRYPAQSWNETEDIAFYLQQLWRLLNDDDYVGL